MTARDQLKAIVERIERLEQEKKAVADDIKDVYAEAKGNGYDVKALRTLVKLRKQDKDEREEQEAVLATYMVALGMLADTPLGESAIDRAGKNSKRRLTESMKDVADVAQEIADLGLTSQEAAQETKAIARAVAAKLGTAAAMAPPMVIKSPPLEIPDIPPFLDRRTGTQAA